MVKIIKNKKDHEHAMKRITELMATIPQSALRSVMNSNSSPISCRTTNKAPRHRPPNAAAGDSIPNGATESTA